MGGIGFFSIAFAGRPVRCGSAPVDRDRLHRMSNQAANANTHTHTANTALCFCLFIFFSFKSFLLALVRIANAVSFSKHLGMKVRRKMFLFFVVVAHLSNAANQKKADRAIKVASLKIAQRTTSTNDKCATKTHTHARAHSDRIKIAMG